MPAKLNLPRGPGWKTCSKCGEAQFVFMFRERRDTADGFRHDCLECTKQRDREYNDRHPDRLKKSGKPKPKTVEDYAQEAYEKRVWRALHREESKQIRKRHYQKHRDAILKSRAQEKRDYYHNNKAKCLESQKIYVKKKRKEDPVFRLLLLARGRIKSSLKGHRKSARTEQLVGCSAEELKSYFFSLFTPDMTMEHFMRGEIHVDHIRPCSSFDLSDPEQQKQCFHYTNLQPLWAHDNLRKSDKIMPCPDKHPEFSGQPVSARIYREKNDLKDVSVVAANPVLN
jgi:hypothetical protein